MNIILRPVYNRPEMLYLSIEYEVKARESFGKTSNLKTMFLVEHDSPPQTLELVDKYPYDKEIIFRKEKFGLTRNILEGMKEAFSITDNYVIYIEDDILVHKTYFQYLKSVMSYISGKYKYSVISPYNFNDNGDVHIFRRAHHYAALAPLINKKFFNKYIAPCIGPEYYYDFWTRDAFIQGLNEKYRDYWESRMYKYGDSRAHNEQAGLINRLVDVAMIENDMFVFMPRVNRQIHIGFYGKNRVGSGIPGKNFKQRLNNLRDIVENNKFAKVTQDKRYMDYLPFSEKLENWNGSLILEGDPDIVGCAEKR